MKITMFNKIDGPAEVEAFCDVCGKRIENPGLAMVWWRPHEIIAEAKLIHKGECDLKLGRHRSLYWHEAQEFFDMLARKFGRDRGKP